MPTRATSVLFVLLLWPALVALVRADGQVPSLMPGPTTPAVRIAMAARDTAPVPVPEASEKALRYYRSGNVLWLLGTAWGLLVPVLLLVTGFSAGMRTWARRLGRKWFLVIVLYFLMFSVVGYLADWPLSFYAGYVRPHAYGLSHQTFAKWFGDSLKELLVVVIGGTVLVWLPYLAIRRFPHGWWVIGSVVALPVISFFVLITPIWIDPLFNQFGPMRDRALERDLLSLADRAGIEGSRVFEVNKSIDTRTVNAYVTGFRQTKRIVLWDTLVARLDRPELLFVMGHEMGHYVLGHVGQLIVGMSLLTLVTLYAVHRVAGGIIRRFKGVLGFDQLSDVASLPLLLLFFQISTLLLTPPMLAFIRHNEHEADRFGLELTRDNHAAATGFVKLQEENLGNPRPGWWFKLWRATHPPLGERIDFCNTYHPWREGQPLRYQGLFQGDTSVSPRP
jgi:STE24 endopeptidase